MEPSSRTLVERVAHALETVVLPALPADDKWAASTVRSAMTLLGHVAGRIEAEPAFLAADNADAAATAREIAALLPDDNSLRDALAGETSSPLDLPAMEATNARWQALFERLLADLYEGAWADDGSQPVRAAIRAYLARRMERERDIYFPVFTGPPF